MVEKMLSKAILLATNAHDGQFDKSGRPYILHCLTVMHKLRSDDEDLMCIAVLHDIMEDTEVTGEQLREAGFSDRVIAGVKALTRLPGQIHEQYRGQVLANPDAIRVKMCDLQHNSDILRLKGVTSRDLGRISKYHAFYFELKEALSANKS